ncbi:MAG: BlaI/MecI/CopY family transcriptional regulator [bacterium]
MPDRAGRARGELEREVLAALAAGGRALTATEVLDQLGGGLAYTTVMTTLSRLHAKHAITRIRAGRAFAYALAGGTGGAQASVTAFKMHRLLDGGHDRVGVLSRFVADLSPQDERLLADILGNDRTGHDGSADHERGAGDGGADGRSDS